MAKETIEKEIIISVNTNASQTTKAIEKVTEALREETEAEKEARIEKEKLAKAQKDLDKETNKLNKSLTENTLMTQGLDKVTGGLYSTIKGGYESLKGLVTGIKSYTVAQKGAEVATKGTSTAMGILKGAIASTGIGVIVVVLASLIALTYNYFTATEKATKALEKQKKVLEDINNLYKGQGDDLTFASEVAMENARRMGASEEEIAKIRTNFAEQRQALDKKELTDLRDKDLEYRRSADFRKLKDEDRLAYINNYAEQEKAISARVTASKRGEILAQLRDQSSAEVKERERLSRMEKASKDSSDRIRKEQASQQERQLRLVDIEYGYRTDVLKDFVKENVNIIKKHNEDIKKNLVFSAEAVSHLSEEAQKYYAEIFKKANSIVDAYYENLLDKRNDLGNKYKKFLDLDKDYYKKLGETINKELKLNKGVSETLKKYKDDYKELGKEIPNVALKVLEVEKNALDAYNGIQRVLDAHKTTWSSVLDAKNKVQLELYYNQQSAIIDAEEAQALKELKLLGATEEEKQKIREAYSNRRVKLEEDTAQSEEAIQEEKFQNYLKISDGIAGTFDAFAQSSKEAGGLQKGFAIASVIMDTTAGAIETFRGISKSFGNTPWGMALAGVASAGVVANGLSAVNRIKAVKTDGSEKGGSATASATMTPNVQFVSSSDNQISNTIAEVSPEDTGPIKAYVVTSEIETGLQLDRNAIASSSL